MFSKFNQIINQIKSSLFKKQDKELDYYIQFKDYNYHRRNYNNLLLQNNESKHNNKNSKIIYKNKVKIIFY